MTLAFGGLTAATATASAASAQPRNSVTLTAVQGAQPSDAVLVVATPALTKTVATTELAKSKSKKKKGLSVVAILIILVLLGLLVAAVILVVLAMKRRGNDRH
ncbi:beta-lactamase regulating signal transducer with metallopeptidase domain [Kitasatospora gansuensis]|uniref:Beta-lactamase regulating signal transducer with metallopeptidase domain n=1 Tax=Kitasatospora gansuensis TaxID=258050 RepID=A0A7W7SED1_9ACTN|nr:hypothetical protein [Kitasatospora gansuensis]MBB4948888.1 beta-lactamase regulating signal transducer with metallopeptidase domain [Kitasatospora gansuensis]